MKILPIPMLDILPVLVMATVLSGCHATTTVEASTTRDPVVAPAGTVLRVRLMETLETGRSRPGDRFSGVLESALLCGSAEVLPKGTKVEGRVAAARVVTARDAGSRAVAVLAVKLENYERDAVRYPVAASVVTRTAPSTERHVALEAGSIIGFTLTGILVN